MLGSHRTEWEGATPLVLCPNDDIEGPRRLEPALLEAGGCIDKLDTALPDFLGWLHMLTSSETAAVVGRDLGSFVAAW